jgi:hypothetical protein
MFRLKNMLFAMSVLLTIECLSLGLFINQIFSWSRQHVAALLNSTAKTDLPAAKLATGPKTQSRLGLQGYRAIIPSGESFFTTGEIVGVSRRSFIITAPHRNSFSFKVSRYIFKSVLNI